MSFASLSAAASAAISVSSMALAVAVTCRTRPPWSGLLVSRISRRRKRVVARAWPDRYQRLSVPLVEAPFGDVLDHAVRHQVPDRLAGRDAMAALAARYRQRGDLHQGDLAVRQARAGQPVARPRAADEVRQAEQGIDIVPGQDVCQGVRPGDEV